jgi:hypothetical protein
MVLADGLYAQVFGFRKPNVWYVEPQPRLGFFLSHSGMDLSSGTTVSNVFCWGIGLDLRFGANFRRLSLNNSLRLQYVESHTTDNLPVKGPSLFEFAMRPAYSLLRDSSSTIGVAFQGGCNTALTRESDAQGNTTRKFFDPGSLYEGIFVSADKAFGGGHELQMSLQLGYSLQQLVYRTRGDASSEGMSGQPTTNWSGGGSTAFFTIAYNQREATLDKQLAFFSDLSIKGFRKEPGFKDIKNSRVEATMRVGINILEFLDFLTSVDLIYDSSISPRRELRTSVSFNFKYNIDLSGGL